LALRATPYCPIPAKRDGGWLVRHGWIETEINRYLTLKLKTFIQEKTVEATKQKKKRGKRLSPRNKKACHIISTALMQSVAEIRTQSPMKSSRKTLHELTSHIPPKTPKRNISGSTNEMLHTDIVVRAQTVRVINTHATEATNCH
jgi:hypothetical protein